MSALPKLTLVLAVGLALAGCDSGTKAVAPSPTSSTAITTTTRPASTTSTPTSTPRPSFTASPTHVAIGQKVTFSGNDCPPNEEVLVIISYAPGSSARAKPRADGSWSTTTVIPDNAEIGTVPVFAMCQSRTKYLNFKPNALQISTYRRMIVAPAGNVQAGSIVTLTATGGCAHADALVTVGLFAPSSGTSTANTTLVRQASGDFTGRLLIPPGTAPAAYSLVTECLAFRVYYAYWPTLKINVT